MGSSERFRRDSDQFRFRPTVEEVRPPTNNVLTSRLAAKLTPEIERMPDNTWTIMLRGMTDADIRDFNSGLLKRNPPQTYIEERMVRFSCPISLYDLMESFNSQERSALRGSIVMLDKKGYRTLGSVRNTSFGHLIRAGFGMAMQPHVASFYKQAFGVYQQNNK